MPECVEVECALRAVRPLLVGATIARYRSLHHCFRGELPELTVRSAHRHGKWVVLAGADQCVRLHLGMSGSLRVGGPVARHARWLAVLQQPSGRRVLLQFVDPRCMGRLDVLGPAETRMLTASTARSRGCPLMGLGPDVLNRSLAGGDVLRLRARWRALLRVPFEVKPALMMQHVVAGLGNIYAAEACWLARCSPFRMAGELTTRQVNLLAEELPRLLRRSLLLGGTSIGDANTFRVNGREGRMLAELRVYGREGLPCRRCGEAVRRDRQDGRSTFWCAGCQK